ncbi:uncharacterized protein BP01DRAFT_360219 [Aspergillus saccharolyticus JOP 1030-1]|uniref:DNA polymerase delta subunit 3 n=1 Tax=Aspergillus saccharolyticus JOP 1030-1 TaxID=1450539 RepID=A0A318Z3J6_9EURO|nr:hypothetical protein BP01DRAFT_360219 [Aspergillus saccharolyticus JOP 1030-1]PYH41569.1 hypothetical protein BP01DRAFT_360219 [Aspergillus saccharolyticus JOP 1030-1]
MAVADYKRYLAENVLNEQRTVTYRSLGRALRVHSTLAKQMLYDFHHNENNKKPNSVNATYILTGVQMAPEPATPANGLQSSAGTADTIPPSSPYISSSMPNQDGPADEVAVSSVLLVREEDLDDAKAMFQSIASIYVYSLQPTVLQDLNVLTDVARETLANHAQEDPLEYGPSWGMIQNKNVKRRTGVRPPVPVPAPAKTAAPVRKPTTSEAPKQPTAETKDEEPKSQPTLKREDTPSSTKSAEKTAPVKKEKSSIFSSFAKAKPKAKQEDQATPTPSGADSAEPSASEDVVLDDASEDEPDELFPDSGKTTITSTRESRKEREEKLRKMMEDDDEDEDEAMPDAAPSPEEESNIIDQPPAKPAEPKEEVIVRAGRRRGRRQVMKKKTVKDEEGYLVTVEEPSWESFSEDEPAPPPKKKPAVSAPRAKAGPKAGQGSIMSFFAKK